MVIVCTGDESSPGTSVGALVPVLTSYGGALSVLALVFVDLAAVCTHCSFNVAVGRGRVAKPRMSR